MGPRPRYVVIRQATNGQWYFVLRAGNNKPIDQSELYKRKGTAVNAARAAHPELKLREYVGGRLIDVL